MELQWSQVYVYYLFRLRCYKNYYMYIYMYTCTYLLGHAVSQPYQYVLPAFVVTLENCCVECVLVCSISTCIGCPSSMVLSPTLHVGVELKYEWSSERVRALESTSMRVPFFESHTLKLTSENTHLRWSHLSSAWVVHYTSTCTCIYMHIRERELYMYMYMYMLVVSPGVVYTY